jgi:diacylglycerol kinase family enzyme
MAISTLARKPAPPRTLTDLGRLDREYYAHSHGPRSGVVQIVTTPGSGNGRGAKTALALREALRARGHQVRLQAFSGLESLGRWAVTDGARSSLLICVGGDGTQSAAAAAAVRCGVPFLPVPAGFGNLFARAFGHPHQVERVIDLLEHGRLVRVDVGLRNGELFLCQASFGLLSQIQESVEAGRGQPRGRWRRWLAYYRAAVRYLRDTPLMALQAEVDGRVVATDAAVVIVANVEAFGPWLPLTPGASAVDGLFDVFVMAGASKREILAKLLARQMRVPGVTDGMWLHQGRRVSVTISRSARHEVELVPGVLQVMVAPETASALERQGMPAGGARETWQPQPA